MSSDFGFGTRPGRWLFGEDFWLGGFVLLARWEPSKQVPAKLKAVLRTGAKRTVGGSGTPWPKLDGFPAQCANHIDHAGRDRLTGNPLVFGRLDPGSLEVAADLLH